MKRHILVEYLRFKKSWNPKREFLKDIITFLKFNPEAFCLFQSLLSFYHHLEWLALIENNSDLTSFSTLSELIIKSKHTLSTEIPVEVKEIKSFFVKPRLQEPEDESSMDWSEDILEVQSSPTPHVSPAGENMSSPCTPLHNRDVRGKRRAEPIDSGSSLLNYGGKQPSIPSS